MSNYLQRLLKPFHARKSRNRPRRARSPLSVKQLETRELLSASLPTNAVVVSSADPIVPGQSVLFTAAVQPQTSSSTLPTGTVTFRINGVTEAPVLVKNGLAELSYAAAAAGDLSVVARYNGNATFLPSTSRTFTEVVNATPRVAWQPTGVNVTQYGVIGNGKTDDTAALQKLINNSPNGTLFYFPAGTYLVSSTINFAGLQSFGIEGATTAARLPASVIKDTAANSVAVSVDYGAGDGDFQIENMNFLSSNDGGTGFFTSNAENGTFQNCAFEGNIGLNLQSGFNCAVRSSTFHGSGGAAGSDIGLLEWGPTGNLVEDCEFSGWTEGIRASGTGMSVIQSTFEHNRVGMNLGVEPNGTEWSMQRSSFNNLTFTANDDAIEATNVSACSFQDVSIQGTSSAPSGPSSSGIDLGYTFASTFSGLQITGGFTNAAGVVAAGEDSTFYACNASNAIKTGKVWNLASGLTTISFVSTDPPTTADVDDITASGVVAGMGPVVNVTQYGLVGNGTTDDTAAFQALINKASPGTTFYFPKGTYKISSTINLSRLSSFSLVGDVSSLGGSNAGSTIEGSFAGVLLDVNYGTGSGVFHISNLNLRSSASAGGVALYVQNAVLSSVQNVQVVGNIGIELVDPYKLVLRSIEFNGSLSEGSDIALLVSGGEGCTVEQGDFSGWQEAVRAAGYGLALYACRFEVNDTALNLGVGPDGSSALLQNASFEGLTMEANNIFANFADCLQCLFAGSAGEGSTNAPAGVSVEGLVLGNCQDSMFLGLDFGGAYSNAAIVLTSAASNDLLAGCWGSNGNTSTGAITWDIESGANATIVNSNN